MTGAKKLSQLECLCRRAEAVGCSARLTCALINTMSDMTMTARIRDEITRLQGWRDDAPEDRAWRRLPGTLYELGSAVDEFDQECDNREVWRALRSLSIAIVGSFAFAVAFAD